MKRSTAIAQMCLFLVTAWGCAERVDQPAGDATPPTSAFDDDLAYLDIGELQIRMEDGTLTAEQLVSYHVERIAEIDKTGPRLGAVIEINPGRFRHRRRARSASGPTRVPEGPLHGIPVLLKANIDTGDENGHHRRLTRALQGVQGAK